MIMKIRTRLIASILGSALLFCAAIPAHAVAMFEFDLWFDTGPLSPNTITGTFSVDQFAGVGSEAYYPDGPSGNSYIRVSRQV